MNNLQGTLPFISIELLQSHTKPVEHLAKHDLESFFYVLLYVCTMYEGPGRWKHNNTDRENPNHPFGTWLDTTTDWHGIAAYRISQFINPEATQNDVFQFVNAYFAPLIPLLEEFCNIIFGIYLKGDERMRAPTLPCGTHTAVLTALRRAYNALPCQDDVPTLVEEEPARNETQVRTYVAGIPHRQPANMNSWAASDSGYGGEEASTSTSFQSGSGGSRKGGSVFPAGKAADGERRSIRLQNKRRDISSTVHDAVTPSPKRHRSDHSSRDRKD
jgi:hypothetical protein